MECRHSVSKSNDIDIDQNYDNPVFVSFQTHVRRVVEGLPEKISNIVLELH